MDEQHPCKEQIDKTTYFSRRSLYSKENELVGLLYKNLEHVTYANYSAESAFLGWEAVYAIIEGQLIIGYVTASNSQTDGLNTLKPFLLILGLVLSVSWFGLVIINHKHQKFRYGSIRNLELRLGYEYSRTKALYFCPEDICNEQKLKWKLMGFPVRFLPKIASTWTYRQLVPLSLIILWACLACGISYLYTSVVLFIAGILLLFLPQEKSEERKRRWWQFWK